MALRYDEIADLIKIIDASACEELVLETADLKLVIRRGTAAPETALNTRPAAPFAPRPGQDASSAPDTAPAPPAAPPSSPVPADGITVRAPMVGVFYRAPAPDAPPFVEVGSVVAPGAPLCVIEVMKLFTTIYAESAGRIAQVCATDSEFVEYDRVLFVLESSG